MASDSRAAEIWEKELSLTEIIAIAKIGDSRHLFEESWAEICAKQADSLSKQSVVTCLDKKYPSQLLHLAAPLLHFFTKVIFRCWRER